MPLKIMTMKRPDAISLQEQSHLNLEKNLSDILDIITPI